MRYYKNANGGLVATIGKLDLEEITKEEYETLFAEVEQRMEANKDKAYWQSVDYNEAINSKIRERYTDSQEFAILRQKDEKPSEYQEYYNYCEECKAFVKEMKAKYEI